MSGMTEWQRQMESKFDNIMSGHKVNQDDSDWLRALLHARLRGEAQTCQHEAWEENHGWRKCTDCGHGWRSATAPVAEDAVSRMCEAYFGVQHYYSKGARDKMRRLLEAALSADAPASEPDWTSDAYTIDHCNAVAGDAPAPVAGDAVAEYRAKEVEAMRLADADGRYLNAQGHQQAINAIDFCVSALAQDRASQAGVSLCERLQQKCSDWGTYWRAPDAHGVILTIEQAHELLCDALGVEVEIKPASQAGAVPDAVRALRTLADAVFGAGLGSEPDVYADHDKLCELQRMVRAALAAQPSGGGVPDESAMESWHSAVDDAGELFANAPDDRYASRASRLVTWVKANRPAPAAPETGGENGHG